MTEKMRKYATKEIAAYKELYDVYKNKKIKYFDAKCVFCKKTTQLREKYGDEMICVDGDWHYPYIFDECRECGKTYTKEQADFLCSVMKYKEYKFRLDAYDEQCFVKDGIIYWLVGVCDAFSHDSPFQPTGILKHNVKLLKSGKKITIPLVMILNIIEKDFRDFFPDNAEFIDEPRNANEKNSYEKELQKARNAKEIYVCGKMQGFFIGCREDGYTTRLSDNYMSMAEAREALTKRN